jgi:hypothetical protein
MAFPPRPAPAPAPVPRNTPVPRNAPVPTGAKDWAPAQHSDLKDNPSHDGNHGAHAPNGHQTPADQARHQSNLNSGHGAGTGIAPTGQDRDGDND